MPGEGSNAFVRPRTPEERANYVASKKPAKSTAKFAVGDSAWLTLPKQGSFEVTITERDQNEFTRKWIYQAKDNKGVMYKNGDLQWRNWKLQVGLASSRDKITNWDPFKPQIANGERKAEVRILDKKYKGYRSLSTFLDSDENFMIYRRFGYLHSRILLRKQDELRKLEMELDGIDEYDAEGSEDQKLLLMSRDLDEAADRKEPEDVRTRTKILDDIENKLENYDSWILNSQSMAALNKPANRDFRSVEAYIWDKKPLMDEESGFIYRKEDLITLRDGREMALLDSFTERMLKMFHCSLLQTIFCSKEDREKTTDPQLHYCSKSRKNIFITAVTTLVLLCLLIVPVFVLYRLTVVKSLEATYTLSIGVLLVFTLVFSAVLSLFTQAKRHEIFGAAAGYCAVLVVFISNIPSNK